MLSTEFSESWFNGDHYLVRRKLRPFCLWHYAYLQFVDSPLIYQIKKPAPPNWDDLEQASRICRLRYGEQISPKISLADKFRLFLAMSNATLEQELKAWKTYFNDYFSSPKFNSWKSDTPIKPRGSPPDVLGVASACMMLMGGGPQMEKYVWEMPIGKAYWYSSVLHWNRGAPLDYMTAKDQAMREKLRAMRARGEI